MVRKTSWYVDLKVSENVQLGISLNAERCQFADALDDTQASEAHSMIPSLATCGSSLVT